MLELTSSIRGNKIIVLEEYCVRKTNKNLVFGEGKKAEKNKTNIFKIWYIFLREISVLH